MYFHHQYTWKCLLLEYIKLSSCRYLGWDINSCMLCPLYYSFLDVFLRIVFNPEENAKINNRLLTIITLLISMIGCLLMADWQSIGSDPCLQYSIHHNPSIGYDYGHTITVESEILGAREQCLRSPDNCYWNQYSPLTNVECLGCPPICRGVHKSLNFYLFSIGIAISAFVIPITEVVWTVLITDNLGDDTVEKVQS